MAQALRYFLGANSPQGCVFRYDQLGEAGDWRCWVVTGGSRQGRAELLSRVEAALEGEDREVICSTGDPQRLAGLIFPARKISIVDGESPQDVRLSCPGGYERVVSLWEHLDQERLFSSRGELLRLSREEQRLRKDAGGYLYAAGALTRELVSIGNAAMDREKLLAYARRLAAREFPRAIPGGKRGRESVRFLSALTGRGTVLLRETVPQAAPRTIAIEDSWGAVSNALLEALRELALEAGVDVVSCRSPLFPFTKLEYLFLPGLGLGFFALNPGNAGELAGVAERAIHASRFSDAGLLRERRARSGFLRRAASGMLEQAARTLAQAEAAGRELDALYHAAMDEEAAGEIARRVAAEMMAG